MYKIEFNKDGEYSFNTLPISLCNEMCDVTDLGNRWSNGSRYHFNFGEYKQSKSGFHFGTAIGCIQSYLVDHSKNNLSTARFDIYAVTPNGSKLKITTLKEPS